MKSTCKRLVALLLAALLLFSLAGCKKAETETQTPGAETADSPEASGQAASEAPVIQGAEKVRLEHVYAMQYLDLDLPEVQSGVQYFGNAGQMYMSVYYWNETQNADGIFSYNSGSWLYALSPDCTAVTLVKDFPSEQAAIGEDTTTYSYSSVDSFSAGPDGTVWYADQSSFEDWSDPENYIYENKIDLVQMDAEGNELQRIDTSGMSDEDYFYINTLVALETGELVIYGGEMILVLNADGTVAFKIDQEQNEGSSYSYINSIAATGNGDVIALKDAWDETAGTNESKLYRLDLVKQELTEIGDVPMTNMYGFLGGPGDTIIFNTGTSVYSCDTRTLAVTELVNWINSDVNASRISSITAMADGSFLVSEYDRDYNNSSLARLTAVNPGDVTEKYLIKFAAVYLDDELQDAIISFNKQNTDFRIAFVDYSVYNTADDYLGGFTQLNLDIVSGSAPDIISMSNLDPATYAARGLLADLGALMDADPDFNRADYLENVLNATAINGKLTSVITSFNVFTMAGKPELVGTNLGWTLDDLKALLAAHPDAQAMENMTRSQLLSFFASTALPNYINTETGLCSFNDPSFVAFLEFMKDYPEEIDYDAMQALYDDPEYWDNYDSQYREGRVLLSPQYLYGYDGIQNLRWTFGGDFSFVGFPSSQGIGSNIQPNQEIAISSTTKLTDACWDFVSYLLGSQYQESISWSFPVKRSALEQRAAEVMTDTAANARAMAVAEAAAASTTVGTDEAFEDYYSQPVTQEQVDQINALLERVSLVERDRSALVAIISEEAASYYAGQKTAQAAADVIQSRIQIYTSENS